MLPSKKIPALVVDPGSKTRFLTKSKFKLACECPTKIFYDGRPNEYENDKLNDPFLRNLARGGFQVGAIARLYFPNGVLVESLDYSDSVLKTAALLEKESVTIYEGAFRFENLFVRADVVRKEGDTLFIYEAKAKSYNQDKDDFWQKRESDHLNNDWKEYLYDIAFQHFVIRNSFPKLKAVPHLYLVNKTSVATVEGLNQKFRLVSANGRESILYDQTMTPADLGSEILIKIDVSKEVSAIQTGVPNGKDSPDWPPEFTFSSWIFHLAEEHQKDAPIPPKIAKECKDCEFRTDLNSSTNKKSGFEECWTKALLLKSGELKHRTPIFDIWKLSAPPLLKQGIYFIDQLSEEDFIPKSKSKKEETFGLSTSERKLLQWSRSIKGDSEHAPYPVRI
jgi:hypothetical protein